MRIDGGRGLWGAVLIALLSTATGVHAQGCEPWVARIISVQGPVVVERSGAPRAQAAGLDDTVCPGDRVRVGALGRAAVQLANEAETPIRLDEGTTLIFPAPEPEKSFLLKLIEGVVHVLSRVPQALTIETPMVAAYVEGTEFVLGVSKSEAELWVFEGRVRVSNPQGQLEVRSGEGALARPGQAPVRRVLVKPREAVEWALYYPPLVDPRPESYPPALRATLSAYRANDLPAAFAALERVPARDRDGRYLLLRAGLLLSVGRVSKAEADLAEAERADPKSGGASALRSVIALVRDQKDDALRLAETGAGLDPNSPLPQAALSYAHQGRFEIEKALEHAKRAVELAPEDALLWARVSELELSRGDLDAALEAAQKAETLSPALARTQTVLGFAYLTRIEVDKAKTAFERAIQGDPADPLPRLGMGLAKIRDGDLDEGTREIETAASLDPNNSLVRSYLGKAYYEQKRDGLASSEYEQAKLLDPKDPTPWFYDAIHKQTTNRPVEALHDLQKAIELNDNRAVYRSKLLLDEDLAARSASLGRIYSDLGFEQLGLVEGWKSVNTDPSNYSAHRLLADNYAALPRHEIARVSELLQSQLLQPLNITPVQPNLADVNPLILEGAGPSAPSFNEFNPLFTRNRLALQTSAVVGSNDTYGDEITQSGLWRNFSYSLGQFHFETEGFRENNDLSQDIYNFFGQAQLLSHLGLQVEVRRKETQNGDLDLLFNPDSFSPNNRQRQDEDNGRLGFRASVTPNSDFLVSAMWNSRDEGEDILETVGSVPISGEPIVRSKRAEEDTDSFTSEIQYMYGNAPFSYQLGGGYFDADGNLDSRERATVESLPIPLFEETKIESKDTTHGNGYFYSYARLVPDVTFTVGASFDVFDFSSDSGNINVSQINPKFGVVWDVSPSTTLRLAAFRILKRSLIQNSTIEPTQVAGFNQFFDDPTGVDAKRGGIALDHEFSWNLHSGLEASVRDLDVPLLTEDPMLVVTEDQDEITGRAYTYWTPSRRISVGAEYHFEQFERDPESPEIRRPNLLRNQRIPVTISFFGDNGLFVNTRTTFYQQKVKFGAPVVSKDESFALMDVLVGYRLPKRYGIITLNVLNAFDKEFEFFNAGFQEESFTRNRFIPERTIIGEIILSFF